MLQLSVLASHLLFLGCLQLKALGTEGMIKELIQSLHLAEDMFSRRRSFPNTSIYNTVLHSLVEAEEVNASYNLVIMLYRCCCCHTTVLYFMGILTLLLLAIQSQMAIQMFKSMLSCGYRPDKVTYNVMIDCSSIIRSFKSACALVSMMIRDGFCLEMLTYTSLIKVLSLTSLS